MNENFILSEKSVFLICIFSFLILLTWLAFDFAYKTQMPEMFFWETFMKNSVIDIEGKCQLADSSVLLDIRMNESQDLERFRIGNIKIGDMNCEYKIQGGKGEIIKNE